jgi:uncharacterized protein
MTRIRPVAATERIVFWDLLRGVAVLGILLANMPYMALSGTHTDMTGDFVGGDSWLDHAEHFLVRLFVETKFVTTFSILFGAGLGLLSEKAVQRDTPFRLMYGRRLLVLLVFGVLHGTLLWFGDILATYAMLGFVAMWFRGLRVRTLLIWASTLLAVNWLMWASFGFIDPADWIDPIRGPDGQELEGLAALALQRQDYSEVFSSGDFGRMAATRSELYAECAFELLFLTALRTLALFLVGIALVKSGLFLRVAEHRRTYQRLLVLGLGIGFPLQLAQIAVDAAGDDTLHRVASLSLFFPSGIFLSLGYIGAVALWAQSSLWSGLRVRLAAVGRMAFTSYLSHSAITAIVFNYLGLYDQWRRPGLFVLALAIFAFQLWFSPMWLRHFRFGPLEWVWRSLTYLKIMPLRRSAAA